MTWSTCFAIDQKATSPKKEPTLISMWSLRSHRTQQSVLVAVTWMRTLKNKVHSDMITLCRHWFRTQRPKMWKNMSLNVQQSNDTVCRWRPSKRYVLYIACERSVTICVELRPLKKANAWRICSRSLATIGIPVLCVSPASTLQSNNDKCESLFFFSMFLNFLLFLRVCLFVYVNNLMDTWMKKARFNVNVFPSFTFFSVRQWTTTPHLSNSNVNHPDPLKSPIPISL